MLKHLRDIVARLPDTTPKNYDSLYGKRKVEKVTLGQNDDYYIGSDDKGAKKFVAKHEVEVHDYPVQNDGDVPFKAVNIKPILSSDVEKQHGYQGYPAGEDKKVYEEVEQLDKKSVSENQQKLMAMALMYKRGKMKNASPAVIKLAKSMTEKQLEDFAKTKHKGLPEKVDKKKE